MMAKFLDTTGVSYHLQQLINQAQDTLILISPFLKLNDRLRQSLEDKDRLKIDIRLIYGKNELQPEQINWLRTLHSVRTSFCENLHAKCYLNEGEAILTSMNLYEFSQVNNHEMGVYVTKAEEPGLFADILSEARRLIRISDEIRVTVEKVKVQEGEKPAAATYSAGGFCIRCGKGIPLNPAAPYCPDCYRTWKRYENPDYQEAHCHICGKEHLATLNKPACYDCYKSSRGKFERDRVATRQKPG